MSMIVDQVQSVTGDMDAESFRRYGHQVVDWIADYLKNNASEYPVLSHVEPGQVRSCLSEQAPLNPDSMENILADLKTVIVPGITHWNSAGFMGYFGLSGSGPSILAEMFDATFNVTRMLWRTSPAATELEQVTLNWLRQMLGLPDTFFGMLHHNSAIVHALVAAREMFLQKQRQEGVERERVLTRLRLYASQEAHSSVDKAAMVLGIDHEGLRKVATDDIFRMDVAELERVIVADLQAGFLPFAVVATVGTTSTTSIDPVPRIAEICERYGLWLHVDAAFAGAAAILPSKRWILHGCERADSFSVNPHKWLFTSFGCSAFYTRRPEMVKAAFSLTPDYLHNPEEDADDIPNLMDYDFSLPHRFPALKLWMVMRYFGQYGLKLRIAEHCRLALLFAGWVKTSPDFELMAPVPLSVVCFRAHPAEIDDEKILSQINERILQRVNENGHFFLSHTYVHGKYTLRVAISNIRTMECHVCGVWEELQVALGVETASLGIEKADNFQSLIRLLNLPSTCD